MKTVVTEYGPAAKNILKTVGPFRARPVMVSDTGITPDEDGRKIVPEGSFLDVDGTVVAPGATVAGISLHRVDVTHGPAPSSFVYEAVIDSTKLPVQPDTATKTALKMITFFDLEYK